MEAPPFALYNPALLPPDVLLSEFTARRPLLARLLDIIRANDPGEPAQHVLCVGPRGMGKTTLLCAIAATIKLHEPELAKQWQPVIFDEESRRIGDLADFWLECIRQWESETEPTLTRSHRIDALLAKPGPDIEDKAREVFLGLVDASGKRALLLIDNLNDIFIAVNDAESLMRLRSFLMSNPRVMIIGAATRWFSDVTGLDKPFFEFFRPFDLHALSLEEMRECLAGVAAARGDQRVLDTLKDRPGSIEVLHILTGGNPRLIRTFYRLLNEGMNGELRLQLQRLIDDYTPYHKAIIDALPGQQQRVLDAIALEWNPTDVSTVARTTRLPSNQVSAQIKALTKAGLISEAANMGHSKKKAYLLTDRFSNIHYLMRHGRTGKLKMHWYVMTLRSLFDDQMFAEVAAKAVREAALSDDSKLEDAVLIAQSVIQCANSEVAKQRFFDLIMGSPEHDKNVDVRLAERICVQLRESDPSNPLHVCRWGRFLDVHLNQPNRAEETYRQAISLDPNCAEAWNNLGLLLVDQLQQFSEGELCVRRALEIEPNNPRWWTSLGFIDMVHFARFEDAAMAYKRAVELDPRSDVAWLNLGAVMQMYLQRPVEAEVAYRKAISINPREAAAWSNLGNLLSQKEGGTLDAVEALKMATAIAPDQADYWHNLAVALQKAGNLNDAEDACRTAVKTNPMSARSHSLLTALLSMQRKRSAEPIAHAVTGLSLDPSDHFVRNVFRKRCFAYPESLRSVLPEVSHWCTQHPDDQSVLSFMVDSWIAYAKVTSASEARELLDAQPDEVKLAFETVRDAFLAHDDKGHLHRLAPERRAPVLKLLERL